MFNRYRNRVSERLTHDRKGWRTACLSSAIVVLFFSACLPASAQLNIQIGGSEADFKARLASEGYNRIDTRKLGLSESKFDACKGDKRYRIEFEWTGRVKRKVIGDCRTFADAAEVQKMLREKGYRRIDIEDRAGRFLAVACIDNRRFRVEVNYFGDITRVRRIGACASELSPADISARLKADGYNRVSFTDRQLPRYVAEVCRDLDRLELVINRFGEIANSRRIGACRAAVNPGEIAAMLEQRGYSRVKVIDGQLPGYLVQACKDGRRFEVSMNRWGNISDEVLLGDCERNYNRDEIAASMRDNGFTNISVSMLDNRFVVRGCRDNKLNQITLTRFGRLVDRKELGSCSAPRINDLAETLRKRGLRDLEFFVEACRGNRKVRISFDEFANRTGREVIGQC